MFEWLRKWQADRKAEDFAILSDVREKVEYNALREPRWEAKDQAVRDLAAWAEHQPGRTRRLYLKWIDYFQRQNAKRMADREIFRRADAIKADLQNARKLR